MNNHDLLEKYHALEAENDSLRKENAWLKSKLYRICPSNDSENIVIQPAEVKDQIEFKVPALTSTSEIPPQEKIKLFRTLFAGRDDVYAKRWQNKKGEQGYVPIYHNEIHGYPYGFQIQHSPKICNHRPKDCLVWKHQSTRLWSFRRNYNAHRERWYRP